MARGRPPKGLSHVDSLPGDEGAKAQVKTILATLTGQLTVARAASRLGVSESRFHQLRRQALESMIAGMEPGSPGRPPAPKEPKEVRELKERISRLEEDLEISQLRTEIAMWKPSLLKDTLPPAPEKRGFSPKRRPGKPSGGDRSDT